MNWKIHLMFFLLLVWFFLIGIDFWLAFFMWLIRSTGDSHPCSFTRDSYTLSTPASSTKKILCEHVPRNIPMAYEIEEFFAFAEKQHHRIFMEKYYIQSLSLFFYQWSRFYFQFKTQSRFYFIVFKLHLIFNYIII